MSAILLATLVLSAVVAGPAAGQVDLSGPSEQAAVLETPVGEYEEDVIRRSSEARPSPAPSTAGVSETKTTFDLPRVVLALAGVVGLIFLLKWLARQYLGGGGFGRASRAVEVLGRSMISPRQQLLLVRVGRRVVVVADGAGKMSPICEIGDPQEVAEIIGQVQAERNDSITRSFGALFGRADQEFEKQEIGNAGDGQEALAEPPEASAEDARDEIRGLLEKVQGLSRQFKRG